MAKAPKEYGVAQQARMRENPTSPRRTESADIFVIVRCSQCERCVSAAIGEVSTLARPVAEEWNIGKWLDEPGRRTAHP